MNEDKKLPGTFPGHRYWKAIQGSVDAILAPIGIKRRVVSRGNQFINYDAWTGRAFTEHLCDSLSKHPDRGPTKAELKQILVRANALKCPDPHIRVAKMPERVNHRVALAIIGGGYHEAWHTKYSKRDRVRMSEIVDIVDMVDEVVLAGGKFDEKMRGLLTTLHHLIEDIRIERRGNEDFPGAAQPMRDLQDFILDLESKDRAQGAKVKNVTVTSNARSILLCALRDLGLGYNTHKARETLEFYKQAAPGAIALLAPGGLLAPMLHESTVLKADDKMGGLRVAMKIVVALWRATQSEGQQEEKPELSCPQCGAGPKHLIVRSVRDEHGRKVRGRAEMECKQCGFKHRFDLPDNSLDFDQKQPEPDEDAERPEVEDLDQDDVDGGDGFGDDRREKARGQLREYEKQQKEKQQKEKQQKKQEPSGEDVDEKALEFEDLDPLANSREEGDEESPDAEADKNESESEGEDKPEGEEDGLDSIEDIFSNLDGDEDISPRQHGRDESEEGDGDEPEDGPEAPIARPTMPDRSDGEGSEGDEQESSDGAEGETDDEDWEMSGEELLEKLAQSGARGINLDLGADPDSFLQQVEDVMNGEGGDGIINNIAALQAALEAQSKAEVRALKGGEMVWSPYNPMLDEARVVRSRHKDKDLQKANEMLAEVRGTVTFLRSRLRMIVRAQEMTDTAHGVRRGRKLSPRMLVDTTIDLRSGRMPSRAFQVTDTQVDTSFALAMCLDQSGSMWGRVREVAQCMMVMADAVEGIGGKSMAFGFRNGDHGDYRGSGNYMDKDKYHRVCGVRYDVFKMWGEKFVNSKWRFAHTQAGGSTPMADGVQFGIAGLNERREAHRVLAVITDGVPDSPHEKVIARQVRLATDAGIHVIGVGIGEGAQYVKDLFPDHVHAETVEDLPKPLLKKLNELCDFQGRYRGKRARLDGKVTRKVS